MYVPEHFRIDDRGRALALIEAYPFAAMIGVVDGEPYVTHVPMQVAAAEPLTLSGHVARANPHAGHLDGARVRIIFSGPHGYVSPRWYAQRSHNVPTWNYQTVHCTGTVSLVSDDAGKLAVLDALVRTFETGADGWRIEELAGAERANLLRNIVAFTVAVDAVDAKFKLSQNRSRTDRDGAIAGLRRSGRPSDHALADVMD